MRVFALLCSSVAIGLAQAAPPPPQEADQLQAEARVQLQGPDDLALLQAAPLSVEGMQPEGWVRVVGARLTLEDLAARGLAVELVRADHRLGPPGLLGYRSTEEVLAELESLAEAYPERCELADLGRSAQGYPLLALRIDEGPVRVRLLGTYHGNEPSSTEVALASAERLLAADPIPEVEVWVMPLVNPDGHHQGSRYNSNGIDLNRNHDYAWSEEEYRSGAAPFSEPETRALRALSSYVNFATGLTLHSGALCIGYAWGYQNSPAADEDVFLRLEDAFVRANGFAEFDDVGLGYNTWGDTNDWAYGRHGTLDFTVEVSSPYAPPEATLPMYIGRHWDSIEPFLQQRPTLLGSVVDAEDGAPLEASVIPEGRRPSVAGTDGRFARFLAGDSGELTISAPGYQSERITWAAGDGEPDQLEVALEPLDLLSLRAEPALLPWTNEPQQFWLEGLEGESITLWRPGHPSHELAWEGEGWSMDPSLLAPGPWSVSAVAGSAPRALFVAPWQQNVELESTLWTDDEIVVRGAGFGRGSRAWLIGDEKRHLTPCPVLAESDGRLQLDASAAAQLEPPVDLLVLSAGAQLTALDLLPEGDTGYLGDSAFFDSNLDTAEERVRPESGVEPAGCACSAGRASSAAGLLLALLPLGLVRRRR